MVEKETNQKPQMKVLAHAMENRITKKDSTKSFGLDRTLSDNIPQEEFQHVCISKHDGRDKEDENEKESSKPRFKKTSPNFQVDTTSIETLVLETEEAGDRDSRTDGTENKNTMDRKSESKMQDLEAVIEINGQEFDVHKTLFRKESTYFRETFAGRENKQINSKVTNRAAFQPIRTFLYNGKVEITSNEFLKLLSSSILP
ncbi:hypothetical protein JTE90_023520 [Oedothorax gibbosus]|uniref:BTB domain-containing protein n=1 Tax=Oedothorax gibbosus TaxID=931172 RepID=A0AAV6VRR3_9ARAC|nr:hypothetical protein JTE90_023520 [Oedothorax gibbosus]